jgi:hypothetical protein
MSCLRRRWGVSFSFLDEMSGIWKAPTHYAIPTATRSTFDSDSPFQSNRNKTTLPVHSQHPSLWAHIRKRSNSGKRFIISWYLQPLCATLCSRPVAFSLLGFFDAPATEPILSSLFLSLQPYIFTTPVPVQGLYWSGSYSLITLLLFACSMPTSPRTYGWPPTTHSYAAHGSDSDHQTPLATPHMQGYL